MKIEQTNGVLNEAEFIDNPAYQLLNSGEMACVDAKEDVVGGSDSPMMLPAVDVLLTSQHCVNKSLWALMQFSLESSFLEYKK